MTDGSAFWLGIAYWVFGVALMATIGACLLVEWSKADQVSKVRHLAAFSVFNLLAISTAPFVQPRYLMASFPVSCTVLLSLPSKWGWRVVLGTATLVSIIIMLYSMLGYPPPSGSVVSIEAPDYIQEWKYLESGILKD
jgi:hypothetical protein